MTTHFLPERGSLCQAGAKTMVWSGQDAQGHTITVKHRERVNKQKRAEDLFLLAY